jgi:hypothetical protein
MIVQKGAFFGGAIDVRAVLFPGQLLARRTGDKLRGQHPRAVRPCSALVFLVWIR